MEAKRQDIGMDIDENKKDTQNKTNRYVYIETAVDFDNLNNVLVIKK